MIRVRIRAQPGAREERVSCHPDGSLGVKVRAPALDGKANIAIEQAVASALGLRSRQVHLVRGQRSRVKVLEVDLPDVEELNRRLVTASQERPRSGR